MAEDRSDYHRRLHREGRCGRCCRPVDKPGAYRCSKCSKIHNKKGAPIAMKRHNAKKSEGLCVACGKRKPFRTYLKCKKCRSDESNRHKLYLVKLKSEVFSKYGSICQCCGETELSFLTIDHIANDGPKHRRKLPGQGRGKHIYDWLKRNSYPDGFQVLCMNCNWGKHVNHGTCPHKA